LLFTIITEYSLNFTDKFCRLLSTLLSGSWLFC